MKLFFVFLWVFFAVPFCMAQQADSVTRARKTDSNAVPATDTIPAIKKGDTLNLGDNKKGSRVKVTGDTMITGKKKKPEVDSLGPRKAAIRSAILPGLGQIYNRKYWKLPLVYAGVGIPAYLIFDNRKWYQRSRFALILANQDTITDAELEQVHPQLRTFTRDRRSDAIRNYRNEFRKNMDYSILVTLLFWGLNVIDATVDAHLKGFDVSDDVALKVRPVILPGTMTPGVSFVFNLKDSKSRTTRLSIY